MQHLQHIGIYDRLRTRTRPTLGGGQTKVHFDNFKCFVIILQYETSYSFLLPKMTISIEDEVREQGSQTAISAKIRHCPWMSFALALQWFVKSLAAHSLKVRDK